MRQLFIQPIISLSVDVIRTVSMSYSQRSRHQCSMGLIGWSIGTNYENADVAFCFGYDWSYLLVGLSFFSWIVLDA